MEESVQDHQVLQHLVVFKLFDNEVVELPYILRVPSPYLVDVELVNAIGHLLDVLSDW